ncbi:hypothetical protein K227x_44030 [Rubripirellula lacrimiformis]|uniref:Uncharacterized protein n=1 Tax=Rubripirellula lacrimiformis TaxID=1930273 RepID=A0A517NFS8_9BACT|nr:hypothetical protein [Rubripirellula lacrimiformis]QDT05996.1 hypothetical protein K227x_44030 [Rubripirellula lacrimiformis]
MKTPSYQPIERSRMLPRISFRWMFALTTLGAILAAVAKAAGSGASFAVALMVTIGFIGTCFALFVLIFAITLAVSSLWYQPVDDTHQGSPFAADQLPPQILPPREGRS